MTQEQENFYRHSTVIVDESKDAFLHLLDFHLLNQGITLQRFIEIHGHEIYHLCFNQYPCCLCPAGTRAAIRGGRVLNPPQIEVLFDKTGNKLPGHNPGSKSAPNCCCPVNPNLQLQDLDFILARLLLVNFTTLVPQGSLERNALDSLVNFRNHSYAHAKKGKISNSEYKKSMYEIEKCLLVLAKVYGKEIETKQRLRDVAKQPLNTTLVLQLQNTLLQQCQIDETIQRLLAEKTLPDCLTKDLCDVTVNEGCDAHFEIWTKEDFVDIIWYKDRSELLNCNKFIIHNSGKIHTLDIKNTDLSDKGLYSVIINDIERRACLQVVEYFTKNLQSVECKSGKTVEFICEVIEDSLPACWQKNGIKLKNDGKYEILQVGKIHRLSIQHCDLLDAGDYEVNINHRVRTASLSVIDATNSDDMSRSLKNKSKAYQHGTRKRKSTLSVDGTGTKRKTNVSPIENSSDKLINNSNFQDELEIPDEIKRMGRESIQLYLKILQTGTERKRDIRILLVGKKGSGKTSLARRLLQEGGSIPKSTNGIEIHVKHGSIRIVDGMWMTKRDDKDALNSRLLKEVVGYSEKTAASSKEAFKGYPEASTNESTAAELETHQMENRNTVKGMQHISYTQLVVEPETNAPDEGIQGNPVDHKRDDLQINESLNIKVIEHLQTVIKAGVKKEEFANLFLWDFAGDEEFYNTHQIFLAKDVIYLVLTRLDDNDDGQGAFKFWFDSVHCFCDPTTDDDDGFLDPPILVVGTHSDMFHGEIACENHMKMQIAKVPAEIRFHIRRIEILSNIQDTDDKLNKLKQTILETAKLSKSWNIELPLKFILLEQALQGQREMATPILSFEEIRHIARETLQPITDQDQLELFLRYQHEIGNLIYFTDIPEYIVLDTQWLADVFRCIVTADKYQLDLPRFEWDEVCSTGRLDESLLGAIFLKQPKAIQSHKKYIVKLMEKFYILVRPRTLKANVIEQNSEYYVPCLVKTMALKDVDQKFGAIEGKSICFCLSFNFLPPMLFNQLLIACCQKSDFSCATLKIDNKKRCPAFFRDIAVFDISSGGCEKLLLARFENVIQLQVWRYGEVQRRSYEYIRKFVVAEIEKITSERFRLTNVTFTEKMKCEQTEYDNLVGMEDYIQDTSVTQFYCVQHGKDESFINNWYGVKNNEIISKKPRRFDHINFNYDYWFYQCLGINRSNVQDYGFFMNIKENVYSESLPTKNVGIGKRFQGAAESFPRDSDETFKQVYMKYDLKQLTKSIKQEVDSMESRVECSTRPIQNQDETIHGRHIQSADVTDVKLHADFKMEQRFMNRANISETDIGPKSGDSPDRTSDPIDIYFVDCIVDKRLCNKTRSERGASYLYLDDIPVDRYFVHCIVDKRLEDTKKSEKGNEISVDHKNDRENVSPYSVLTHTKTSICRGGISATLPELEKLILDAVQRRQSLLCRLILSYNSYLNISIPCIIHAMEMAMKTGAKDLAKAISWFITRAFVKSYVPSLSGIRDIWPALVCECHEKISNQTFCSQKMCIVIETTDSRELHTVPKMFHSVAIKIVADKNKEDNEAKLINNKIRNITHISISQMMSVTGEKAEQLFKKHSKLTIICNSLCKSKGYKSNLYHEMLERPCIQLYCRAKGFIPVGEDHLPQHLCGLQTDILEGLSSFKANIRIGDMVGTNDRVGTLGGFVKVRGDIAFLTCCHVILNAEGLAPVDVSFDDDKPVWIEFRPQYPIPSSTGGAVQSYNCGRVREAPAFETDDPHRVSLDAALVTIEGVTIDKTNMLANKDNKTISMADLGLKSEFLNENCLDCNEFCYGSPRPKVRVVSAGAKSGIYSTDSHIEKARVNAIDLQNIGECFSEVTKKLKQQYIHLIEDILKTDDGNEMRIDIDNYIEQKGGTQLSSELRAEISEVIKLVVGQFRAKKWSELDIDRSLCSTIRGKQRAAHSPVDMFGRTHIQTCALAETSKMRDTLRLSRQMYNQVYITHIPFQSGDSGTCIYVVEPHISGCIAMAIANHPGGGCIATPIIDILRHFKIRIKTETS